MSSRTAKTELSSLTDFQKTLHTNEDGKEITSDFIVSENKKSWYANADPIIKPNQTGDNFIYPFDRSSFHYIRNAWLEQKWPRIAVKEQYAKTVRICWTHNPAIAVVQRATFNAGQDQIQQFDRQWFEIHSQHYIKPGFENLADLNNGNTEEMQEWNTLLQEETTSLYQPWIFSKPETPFPLFPYKDSTEGVYLQFEMDLGISRYLRMQVLDNGVWKSLKEPDLSYVTITSKKSNDNKLDIPELKVRYSIITDEEYEYLISCQQPAKIAYLYEDIVHLTEENPGPLGRTAQFILKETGPCRVIHFNAENVVSREQNLYSNYSTSNEDIYGLNPIDSASLSYGDNNAKFLKYKAHFFNRQQVYDYSTCVPRDIGYHMFSHGNNPQQGNDTGLDYSTKPARLSIHLIPSSVQEEKNMSIRSKSSAKGSENDESFIVHVNLVITHRITFTYDSEKKKWKITIE
jgi:hypothetical protein